MYKCSCCGREVEDVRAHREVKVAVRSVGCWDSFKQAIGYWDSFKQDVLCDVCYKELLFTINAYCIDDA